MWSPRFNPEVLTLGSAPVWVRLGYLASAVEENCSKKNVSINGLVVGEAGEGVGLKPAPEVVVEFGSIGLISGDGSLTVDGVVGSIIGAHAIVSGDESLVPDGDDNPIYVVGDKDSIISGLGSAFVSPNKFDTLSSVGMDPVVSPIKERLVAAGVGDLLNQLKPKGKWGGQRVNKKGKGKKGGASPYL
ncbi:hypothetical protein V6N12_051916 [Hibiscus sabdariffa]|uniref:DUF4283 domain-containing protein n=1 Tax=Hibiscus sabdariffa TaxID=183260 RepID=A0ABR2GGQ7_9ROSI